MIRGSFWTDPDVLQWPLGEQLLFIGLWQLADDSGCLEHSPLAIKVMLFPLKEEITLTVISSWIAQLITAGKLVPYTVDGRQYLYLRKFHDHQLLRSPGRPDVPLPPWIAYLPGEKLHKCGSYRILPPYGDGTVSVGTPYGDRSDTNRTEQKRTKLNTRQQNTTASSHAVADDSESESVYTEPNRLPEHEPVSEADRYRTKRGEGFGEMPREAIESLAASAGNQRVRRLAGAWLAEHPDSCLSAPQQYFTGTTAEHRAFLAEQHQCEQQDNAPAVQTP